MTGRYCRVCCKDRSGLITARKLDDEREEQNSRDYHEFQDEETSDWLTKGYEYEGDGDDTVKFFDRYSNYEELIRQMNYEEKRAFERWTEGGFMNGQQWRGFDIMSDRDQAYTRIYDKFLDKARLERGIVVVRCGSARLLGLDHGRANSLAEIQSREGQIIDVAGNMSFGAAKTGLAIGQSKNVEYRLRIPEKTVGAGMWIGDKRINGWGTKQREFITNRDIIVRQGKTKYDKSRDMYIVELEYLGRKEHDYGRSGK